MNYHVVAYRSNTKNERVEPRERKRRRERREPARKCRMVDGEKRSPSTSELSQAMTKEKRRKKSIISVFFQWRKNAVRERDRQTNRRTEINAENWENGFFFSYWVSPSMSSRVNKTNVFNLFAADDFAFIHFAPVLGCVKAESQRFTFWSPLKSGLCFPINIFSRFHIAFDRTLRSCQ